MRTSGYISLLFGVFPPDLTVSFCYYLYPSVSPLVNEPQTKVKIIKRQHWNHPSGRLLHRVTVMSWKATVKLHDEDSRFSCYRYHSRQPTNQACLSQNGAPIPRLPALELGVMFQRSSGGNCATLLHSMLPPFCCPTRERKCTPSLSVSLPRLSCLSVSRPEFHDSCTWLRTIKIIRGR